MDQYQVRIQRWWGKDKVYSNVVQDSLIEASGIRVLLLATGERIEFPIRSLVTYSPEREQIVRKAREEQKRKEELERMKG